MFIFQNNIFFKLTVKSYEFLNSAHESDLEWLNIKIEAKDNFFEWTSNGAFITVSELDNLQKWFKEIKTKTCKNKRMDFLENELSFQYFEEKKCISVNFDFSFHPKGNEYVYGKDKEYKIFFNIELLDLNKIINDLNFYILKFPKRK